MNIKKLLLIPLLMIGAVFASDPGIYNPEEARALLGYDPRIALIKETDPTVVNTGRKTVYFHGFGSNGEAAGEVKSCYGSGRLPGDVITFDFADAVSERGMDTTKSSLGQWRDMKTALYVLKTLRDKGEAAVGITAHSRGGATAINVVAALADNTAKYEDRFRELSIDTDKRKEMLKMLQDGHIVLECPLTEVRSVVQHQIAASSFGARLKNWFGGRLSSGSIRSSAVTADYCASAVLREYRPWGERAIESAVKWNNAGIPTIVHFQERDEVLGNVNDTELYEKLCASNGHSATHRYVGCDGGHNSSFDSFASERNAFLQRVGAAYKPVDSTLK